MPDAITEKGIELWPAVRCLTCWGQEFYAPAGPRRLFHHAACGTEVDARDVCPKCNVVGKVSDLVFRLRARLTQAIRSH